jgi:hypothetical protein
MRRSTSIVMRSRGTDRKSIGHRAAITILKNDLARRGQKSLSRTAWREMSWTGSVGVATRREAIIAGRTLFFGYSAGA